MKVGKKAYATKGLIETQFASNSPPPAIDNSMDHVTRFISRYSSIYGWTEIEKMDGVYQQFKAYKFLEA